MNIYQVAETLRSEGHTPDLLSIIQRANKDDVSFTEDDLYSISQRMRSTGDILPPKLVVSIFAKIATRYTITSALDPYDHSGLILSKIKSNSLHAITPQVQYSDLITILTEGCEISLHVGKTIEELESITDSFDFIVSCLPFGCKRQEMNFFGINSEFSVRDSEEFLILAKACSKLSNEGTALFVVTQNFFSSEVRKKLPLLNVNLDAAFYLPPGVFSPYTHIPSYIICLKKQTKSELFVAEIANINQIQQVFDNWTKRKAGKTISLGRLLPEAEFESFPALLHEEEILRLSKRLGLPPIQLNSVVTKINRAGRFEQGFEDLPNSVYLPIIGVSPAVSRLSDLSLKPQNYIQIVLDPDKSVDIYVSGFFNSELGMAIRRRINVGAVIPKISLESLRKSTVFIPDLHLQVEAIEIRNEVGGLRAILNDIEQHIWNRPIDMETIKKKIKNINRETGFETWMETLPFPLGSILRRYNTETSSKSKVEHLFHFFEALSQFTTMILLSGIRSDPYFYDTVKDDIFSTFHKDSLITSSFGSWNILSELIAKVIRRELSGKSKDNRERCLQVFHFPNSYLLESLTHKGVFESLRKTAEYRNNWKGHGGYENEDTARKRMTLLESELVKIHEIYQEVFEDYYMVRPVNGKLKAGIFKYQVTSLMGTNPIFMKIEIETNTALDESYLYFIHKGGVEPLTLVPLIKFGTNPTAEENACYFYNRIDKNGVRWVSYHFGEKEEFSEQNSFVQDMLNDLI